MCFSKLMCHTVPSVVVDLERGEEEDGDADEDDWGTKHI